MYYVVVTGDYAYIHNHDYNNYTSNYYWHVIFLHLVYNTIIM